MLYFTALIIFVATCSQAAVAAAAAAGAIAATMAADEAAPAPAPHPLVTAGTETGAIVAATAGTGVTGIETGVIVAAIVGIGVTGAATAVHPGTPGLVVGPGSGTIVEVEGAAGGAGKWASLRVQQRVVCCWDEVLAVRSSVALLGLTGIRTCILLVA